MSSSSLPEPSLDEDSPSQPPKTKIPEAASARLAELFQCLMEGFHVFEETAQGVRELSSAPHEPAKQGERRIFLFFQPKTAAKSSRSAGKKDFASSPGADRYNYAQKYPADEKGTGMDPDARVWRVYLDEANRFDIDMVENIRDTVDVILVFAGLFSAIVGGLATQVSNALKPDYTQVTAALLAELVRIQRAMVAGTPTGAVSESILNLDSPSTASSAERWASGLWFVSLTFSLSAALLSVLVKQWIQAYIAPTFQGNPRAQGRVRHFRYMGIQEWHVPAIAGALPILLHLSLLLFFIGLVAFLSDMDRNITWAVGTIAALAYGGYIATNVLPIWYPSCPYKTPLTSFIFFVHRTWVEFTLEPLSPLARSKTIILATFGIVRSSIRWFIYAGIWLISSACCLFRILRCPRISRHAGSMTGGNTNVHSLHQQESAVLDARGEEIDSHMLTWLCRISSNPSVSTVVTYAVSDLRVGFSEQGLGILRAGILPEACAVFARCTRVKPGTRNISKIREGMAGPAFAALHAHLQLNPTLYRSDDRSKASQMCKCDALLILESGTEAGLAGWQELEPLRLLHRIGIHHHTRSLNIVVAGAEIAESHSGEISTLDPLPPIPARADSLATLYHVSTSKRYWMTILRHTVAAFAQPWALPAEVFTVQHLPELTFWLSKTLTRARGSSRWNQDDLFTRLERTLLSAYVCFWTRPEGANISTQDLTTEALHTSEHTFDLIYSHYHDLRNSAFDYYSVHTFFHVLCHLGESSTGEDLGDPILLGHLLNHAELIGLVFDTLKNRPEIPSLPTDHPLFGHIPTLLGSPLSLRTALQDVHIPSTRNEQSGLDCFVSILVVLLQALAPLPGQRSPSSVTNALLDTVNTVNVHLVVNSRTLDSELLPLPGFRQLNLNNHLFHSLLPVILFYVNSVIRDATPQDLDDLSQHLPHLFLWEICAENGKFIYPKFVGCTYLAGLVDRIARLPGDSHLDQEWERAIQLPSIQSLLPEDINVNQRLGVDLNLKVNQWNSELARRRGEISVVEHSSPADVDQVGTSPSPSH